MLCIEDYNRKLEWLFNRFPSYQKVGGKAYKSGIESMSAFDSMLGSPHKSYKTIHIAGTDGKGSVSHMLAAGLASCGLKVGLYTSPHLKDFRERIRTVCGNSFSLIPEEDVYDFIIRNGRAFTDLDLSFFEITTSMAFKWFESRKVDIAVIETGLGGRLDSTNIISPILSVITNIGLEHCAHLGDTLEKIAYEKAGIIKAGVPVVIGEYLPETKPVFEGRAAECHSEICFASDENMVLAVTPEDLDLKGDYQKRNLKTVSAAFSRISNSLGLDAGAFSEGVMHAAQASGLRGRWEQLQKGPGVPEVICDTGHNAHGLKWVGEQVDRISCDYENVWFIIGLSNDKNLEEILRYLPRNVNYIATQASSSRAMDAVRIANAMLENGFRCRMVRTVAEACREALSKAGPKDLVFIGGSNFVVAEIL